jgi:hypothetical protein
MMYYGILGEFNTHIMTHGRVLLFASATLTRPPRPAPPPAASG